MKKVMIFAIIFILAGAVVLASRTFDQWVSEARRHMRAACQAVQKAVKAAGAESPTIKEAVGAEATEAVRLWTELEKEYEASVPEGYAGDPGWAQRPEDVSLDIARMRKEISSEEWRAAFLSCAHACNLLGTMHEANGVILAIDAVAREVGDGAGLKTALDKLASVVERVYELAI